MGLEELAPFNPDERIIEYKLNNNTTKQLVDLSLTAFADETASESPAPGGGSISAYVGALGVSLGTMVANLSSHKKGWDDRWNEFSTVAEKGQKLKTELLKLVDEDTNAFNNIMSAFALPKTIDEQKLIRKNAIEAATIYAIEVPLNVMKTSFESFDLIKEMAENGNPNSVSDAGVGALCARTAIYGAYLNVIINATGLSDKNFGTSKIEEARNILDAAIIREKDILQIVEAKIKS
jgi:glutamate formiminotransferase/formiminotetrahydrofolate cyclodeaminase